MNKFWNGKISGILSAILLVISIVFSKILIKIKTLLIRFNLNNCGNNVTIMNGVSYRYPKHIEIGNNVIIGKNTELSCEDIPSKYLLIENGASIGNDCKIDFSGGVTIKTEAHIAHNVLISTHDHGYNYKDAPVGKPLIVKENAFIGSNSIILHNVNVIGESAVIGTGAVVTKDVPDFTIVAGNPARIIKSMK